MALEKLDRQPWREAYPLEEDTLRSIGYGAREVVTAP
jgi:hypothetical protein